MVCNYIRFYAMVPITPTSVLLWLLGGLHVTRPLKVAKFFQFSPALRISWSLAEASRQCRLCSLSPLLCQGFKWLNGESVWLVFRRSWGWIPAGSRIFCHGFISHSLSKTSVILWLHVHTLYQPEGWTNVLLSTSMMWRMSKEYHRSPLSLSLKLHIYIANSPLQCQAEWTSVLDCRKPSASAIPSLAWLSCKMLVIPPLLTTKTFFLFSQFTVWIGFHWPRALTTKILLQMKVVRVTRVAISARVKFGI